MEKINSYKFRIYPTQAQAEQMFRTIGCARKMYNLLLDAYEENYDLYKDEKLSEEEYRSQRKDLRPAYFNSQKKYSYLKEVDSTALKYAHKNIDTAYNNFFKGNANKPKHKSRNKAKWSYKTCRASKTSRNVRLEKRGQLVLPKVPGKIKTIVSKNPVGTLVSASIERTRSDKWFVSLQYVHHATVPIYPQTIAELKSPAGIDAGIKDLAITSEGKVYENQRLGYKAKKKIAKLDEKLSRQRERAKKEGRKLSECKNYQKTKVKRAKAYEKLKNQREDTLHKITTDIVNNHDFIAVEDLRASNLMKHHNLAFAIADVSWNKFFTMLTYKSEWRGGIVVTIDTYFASTQICSSCNEKTGPQGFKDLSVREWTCASCGVTHDRDINAAINILYRGLEEFIAVGTTVRDDSIQEILAFMSERNHFSSQSIKKSSIEENDSVRYLHRSSRR